MKSDLLETDGTACGACGEWIIEGNNHNCSEDLSCQLCGEQITDRQGARVILPWGDTCAPCVKQIEEVRKNNGNL